MMAICPHAASEKRNSLMLTYDLFIGSAIGQITAYAGGLAAFIFFIVILVFSAIVWLGQTNIQKVCNRNTPD